MFHLPIYYKASCTYQNNSDHYQLSNTVSISLKSLNQLVTSLLQLHKKSHFVISSHHFVLRRTSLYLVASHRVQSNSFRNRQDQYSHLLLILYSNLLKEGLTGSRTFIDLFVVGHTASISFWSPTRGTRLSKILRSQLTHHIL